MRQRAAGARLFEASLFALAAVLLYNLGPLVVLFLLPIQVSTSRRGPAGLLAAPVALIFFAAVEAVRLAGVPWSGPQALAAGLELALVAMLMAGLAVANLPGRRGASSPWARGLVRLLAGAVVASAGLGAVVAVASRSPAFSQLTLAIFGEISGMLRDLYTASGADSVASSLLAPLLEPRQLQALVTEYLLRSFVLDLFALLAFSWWAGRAAAVRGPGFAGPRPGRFADFRLEPFWLWPLIGSLAIVGVELLLAWRDPAAAANLEGWRFVPYVAWNAALVMLFLYGLQALAIARFWIEERRLPRLLWLLLLAGVGIALASPQVNLVVSLVLPLFGASENWVRYRIHREEPDPGKESR